LIMLLYDSSFTGMISGKHVKGKK